MLYSKKLLLWGALRHLALNNKLIFLCVSNSIKQNLTNLKTSVVLYVFFSCLIYFPDLFLSFGALSLSVLVFKHLIAMCSDGYALGHGPLFLVIEVLSLYHSFTKEIFLIKWSLHSSFPNSHFISAFLDCSLSPLPVLRSCDICGQILRRS